jgi:hypothetical protein
MKLEFIRNIQFSKLIKINGRLKEFNFRKPNSNKESPFTVDVLDERADRVVFQMQKKDDAWKIIPSPLPPWITQNEAKFHEVILEELKVNEL